MKSDQLLKFLKDRKIAKLSAFSIDWKDFYKSLPHTSLVAHMAKRIEYMGTVKFQNATGVNFGSCFCFVWARICNMKWNYSEAKNDMCPGSGIASCLSDLFFATLDEHLKQTCVIAVFILMTM